MFITRATRHDKDDLRALYATNDWNDERVDEGVTFIARDGAIVGAARLVEVAPQHVVVDGVLVREDRRGNGIGTQIMKAAMNSRGGTMFLCCHAERLRFYGDLGFEQVPFDDLPEVVRSYFERVGDVPDDPEHVHYFLAARRR